MIKHIPNAITCCNLLCGAVAVILATKGGQADMALAFIVLGAIFDFFDGMVARLLGVSSPIGKELDSLADVITFGLAPSVMVYTFVKELGAVPHWVAVSSLVMAAFSALRLAKFNLDTRQQTTFLGLPTPANALFWASLLMSRPEWTDSKTMAYLILIGVALSCLLLVSEIPMFALKFKNFGLQGNGVRYGFLLVSAAILMWLRVDGIWLVVLLYVVVSVMMALTAKRRRGSRY